MCDAEVCERGGWTLVDFAAACLQGGARWLQIRAKHMSGGTFLDAATAIVRLADSTGAIVIINDRADIARLAGAGGVHVGQDDLPPADVRALLGAEPIVGLSTHTPAQIAHAIREPVSYVAVGPVFGTATKLTGYGAIGVAGVRLAAAAGLARDLPIVAIGGITLDRAPEVLAAGAHAVAVISDLLDAGDPAERVRAYLDRLHGSAGTRH